MSTVVVDKVDAIYVMTLVRNSQKQSQTKFREAIATNNKQETCNLQLTTWGYPTFYVVVLLDCSY